MDPTMQAVFFHKHGAPDVLEFSNIPRPEPGPGEVVVRLKAAALNRLDLWVLNGWPGINLDYPHISGADGAGEVFQLGEGVRDWAIGEQVVINSNIGCGTCSFCLAGQDNMCRTWHLLGETISGTFAEYVVVSARQLYPLPDGFDPYTAAGAALVFHTAWHSLISRGALMPGEKVLIVGASGGVNTASIQIAKLSGATVYVVGSNAAKLELAESLGADYLVDRSKCENWSKEIYQLTNHQGVDVVVDNVGITFPLSFRSARKGGRILTVGNTGNPKFEIDNRFIFGKHLTLMGSTMGTLTDFSAVMTLIFNGKLIVPLDKTFPLKDARAAYLRLESGNQMGKITFTI
jgi:NADPH:quinone reductase-like Zn-dependent oxidoreductase